MSTLSHIAEVNNQLQQLKSRLGATEAERNAEKLATMLQTTLDGIWLVDSKGKLLDVNDVYLSFVGYDRDEFLALSIKDVEANETESDIAQHIDTIITNGSDRFETRHRRKNGSVFDVEIGVSVLRSNNEVEFICFLRDITQRKRSEFLTSCKLKISELSYHRPLDEVMQTTLDDAEAITHSTIGFFHFVDPDQDHLHLQAWSTNTQRNMCKADGKGSHYAVSCAGIWAECIRTRTPVVHNNYEHAANKKGLPPGHAPILRELTVPVLRNNLVVAVIGVGNKLTEYTDTDVEAVEQLANTVIDIVMRKRAEEALRSMNEELEARIAKRTIELQEMLQFNELVLEASPIGKFIYEVDSGQCIMVNQAAVELLNAPNKQTLLDQNFYTIESWKQSGMFNLVTQTIAQRSDSMFEVFTRTTFDKTAWYNIRCTYFVWKNKAHVMLAATDITQKKESELAIQNSELKFRSLFENITEGVALHEVVYDHAHTAIDYRILDINPAYTEQLGLTRPIVVGKTAREAYQIDTAPYLSEYARVAETGEPYIFETYFAPMKRHFIISVISPRKGQFATVFEDITQTKLTEEELRQKNEELTRFIYTVSHDLKSPLVTIKSFAAYLQEDIQSNDTEAQAKDLKYINNATERMGKLLDELLELSRIGRKDTSRNTISLQQVAQSTVDLIAGRITNRGVQVAITPQPVQLHCDVPRVLQLYQNLIDNAVKFMGSQTAPLIEIGAIAPTQPNGEVVLFVRDNGVGIDPRYQHKLFGLFEKLDPASEGTGIGLALVKRIIEVHGGRIWLESAGENQGCCFYFTLPDTRMST